MSMSSPWNLYFMLSKYAGRLISLLENIDSWEKNLMDKFSRGPATEIAASFESNEAFIAWKKFLDDSLALCNELHLKSTPTRMNLFIQEFSEDIGPLRCALCVREIRSLFVEDLKDIHFESIAPSKIHFYDYSFGDAVEQAFPSAIADIKEAGTCHALNRYTACAFHLIRAMEIALRALAICSGVKVGGKTTPLEYQEWQNIIEGIESKAKQKYGKLKRGSVKTNALAFYQACLSDFNFFKDAVRNILVHNRRGLYKEYEATSVLFRALECFERMAPKISEHRRTKLSSLDFRT